MKTDKRTIEQVFTLSAAPAGDRGHMVLRLVGKNTSGRRVETSVRLGPWYTRRLVRALREAGESCRLAWEGI
jgi:hypothetical protein